MSKARMGAVFNSSKGIAHGREEAEDVSALVIFKVDPEYSEEARKAKVSPVLIALDPVDPGGRAQDIHVVKGLGMGLDEKAIEAVEKWKFKPGMSNGLAGKPRPG